MRQRETEITLGFARGIRLAFLVLVVCQLLHSLEEYSAHLYDRLESVRYVSGLVSYDLHVGLAIIDLSLIALAAPSYLLICSSARRAASVVAWVWVVVELVNATGHVVLAVAESSYFFGDIFVVAAGSYFPGVLTAPLLLAVASILAVLLRRDVHRRAGAVPLATR